MPQNRKIRVQEPIDAVGRAALLVLVQPARTDLARHAFAPARFRQGVDRYIFTVRASASSSNLRETRRLLGGEERLEG